MSKWESTGAENLVRSAQSGIYYLRAKINGRIVRRSLKTDKMRIAKMKRDTLLLQLRGTVKKNTVGEIPLKNALEKTFIYYSQQPNYKAKPKSLQFRRDCLNSLSRTLPEKSVNRISKEDIVNWWNSPEMTRLSASRRNHLLGTIRKLFELMAEEGAIIEDPSSSLKREKVDESVLNVPSSNEFRELVKSVRDQGKRCSDEAGDMIEFLAYSGCRIGEAREIEWSHVSDDFILVTGGANKTKNSKRRHVPIVEPMKHLLAAMRAKNSEGKLFHMRAPNASLKAACERLGLPHYRIHDLRHLFATTCFEAGVDIPTVAKWLGHSDGGALAMRTYGHLRDEHSLNQAAKVRF